MLRRFTCVLGLCISLCALTSTLCAETKRVIWTGWFSDSQCATARAAAGSFSATNPDCAKKCIENGSAPVFISEQERAVFKIKNYSSALDDLGYYLEITGVVDEAEKTISVEKVKRLSQEGAACTRQRKADSKQ